MYIVFIAFLFVRLDWSRTLVFGFQDMAEAEGPVVEKIMGMRTTKKQVRDQHNTNAVVGVIVDVIWLAAPQLA